MPECKYSLVRYFANPIRDEPVNVGVILHSPTDRYFAYQLDLRRVAAKLAPADRDTFKNFESQLDAIENEEIDWESFTFETIPVADVSFLERLADYLGNKIRIAPPRGCSTDDPDQTFEHLFQLFVAGSKPITQKITKRTIIKQVREACTAHGVGQYVKVRPSVSGDHRSYTLPLGIRHAHRRFVEVLKLGEMADKNYRAMAAVARLWQDARVLPFNRPAELYAVIHYANGRVREGERLLRDDGVQVVLQPEQVLHGVNYDQVRAWD